VAWIRKKAAKNKSAGTKNSPSRSARAGRHKEKKVDSAGKKRKNPENYTRVWTDQPKGKKKRSGAKGDVPERH